MLRGSHREHDDTHDRSRNLMARLLWLADDLEAAGLTVERVDGWETRGGNIITPRVIIDHHTAGANNGDPAPSLGICINGRPGLAGPLCNILTDRDSRVWVIASGRSNNAGRGGYARYAAVGNSTTVGHEIEHAGNLATEAINPGQLDTAARVDAVICRRLAWEAGRCVAHKEWTRRKIDPIWSQDDHRSRVDALLATHEDPDMYLPSMVDAAISMVRDEYERHRGPGHLPSQAGYAYWCDLAELAAHTDYRENRADGANVEAVRRNLAYQLDHEGAKHAV